MTWSATDQKLSFKSSAYAIEKIQYKVTDSVAVAKSASVFSPTYVTVPLIHQKNSRFFVDMVVSVDNSNWYDSGGEPYFFDSGSFSYVKRFHSQWACGDTNLILTFYALDSAYTIYYQLVGFTIT